MVLYPNEIIYSYLARYHFISGEKNPLKTYKYLIGIRGYKPLSGLPTRLNQLQKIIFPGHTVKELIENHTHIGYYSPFISAMRRESICQAMKKSGSTKSRLGLLRNHIGAAEALRYCPSCIKEDVNSKGVAYWHREHLLPSVFICPGHEEILYEVPLTNINYHERALLLPGEGEKIIKSITDEGLNKLHFLSKQSVLMLYSNLDGLIDQYVYHKILKSIGLVTAEGHIRQREMHALVTDWLTDLNSIEIFKHLSKLLQIDRPWVSTMVADKREFHHPIKHLILFAALETNYKDVMSAAIDKSEQLELFLEFPEKTKLTKKDITEAIRTEKSLTVAAKKLGCSVTTMTVKAETYGITFKRRTKFITQDLKKQVVQKAKSGFNTKKLAELFHISIGSVNRILRVAGYQHPKALR